MRRTALLLAALALLVAGSAGAAPRGTVKYARIVKQHGAFTAILTYTNHPKRWSPISDVRLQVERDGAVVFRRKLCQRELRRPYRCDSWGEPSGLIAARVGPKNTPAFLVNLWTGGNTCCQATFVATLGSKVGWITHTFSFLGAGIKRMRGHTFFIGSDGRFYCSFSVCAGGATPIQVWKVDAASRFVDVTRSFPGVIRANARGLATGGGRRRTIRDQGSGVLAAWCGDEYLLGKGAWCSRVISYAMKRHWPKRMQGAIPGHGFARALNRDLERWGYKR